MTDLARSHSARRDSQHDDELQEDEGQELEDQARAQRLSRSLIISQTPGRGGGIIDVDGWMDATRHTRSSRSKQLKKLDRALRRYHRFGAHADEREKSRYLQELINACQYYLLGKRRGKRVAAVRSLRDAADAELRAPVAPARPAQPSGPAPSGPAPAPPIRPPAPPSQDSEGRTIEDLWDAIGPRVQADVDRAGANGKAWDTIRADVAGSIKLAGLTGDPGGILDWGRRTGAFFPMLGNKDWITGRRWALDRMASRVRYSVENGPRERAELAGKIDKALKDGNVPLSGDAVIAHALAKGWVEQVGAQLVNPIVPAAPGEQQAVRSAASGKQSADRERMAANGSTGWATLGMWKSHAGEETNAGGSVSYFDEGARAKYVLQLCNGEFFDADGQLAQGPDYSNMSDEQVWYSNAAANTSKRNDILGNQYGWSKQELDDLNTSVGSKNQAESRKVSLDIVAGLRNDPRLIFVMNSSGQFFAAEGQAHVMHHSSFLAGGSIAAAGEIGLSNGKPRVISNESGHYQPGPAYLWQAVRQLKLGGVDVSAVKVELYGCADMTGEELLANFDPTAPAGDERHLSFDQNVAVAAIKSWQSKQT